MFSGFKFSVFIKDSFMHQRSQQYGSASNFKTLIEHTIKVFFQDLSLFIQTDKKYYVLYKIMANLNELKF